MPRKTPTTRKTEAKPKRFTCELLGKEIGTYDCWDNEEQAPWIMYIGYRRNMFGKKAFPEFTDGHDLMVDIMCGIVQDFDPELSAAEDPVPVLKVDWSLFNE